MEKSMAKNKSRTLKTTAAPKPGKRRDKLAATLRHAGASVSCHTLQEAIMAWQSLPAEQKGAATIKVDVREGALYTAAQIEQLVLMNRNRSERRFPSPWSIEEHAKCFMVRDANGRTLGYFYYDDEPRRCADDKWLSKEEARRVAANFAKLPELMRRKD